jgi:hypothetical protein
MWQAAMDMANLEFHHPFWYGQTYSSNLESLLAAPLLWLQVPVYIALPLVTWMLSLLPLLLMAHVAAKEGRHSASILVLLLTLVFPVEHWQTTLLSRGFIQGIACVAVGIYIIRRTRTTIMFAVAGLLMAGGLWQNPNAIFLLALLPMLQDQFVPKSRVFVWLSGGFVASLMWYALRALAVRHPDYVIHSEPSTGWYWAQFIAHLQTANQWLGHTFYSAIAAILLFVIIAILARGNPRARLSLLLLAMGVLLLFGFEKTGDAVDNVYFGPARFFMAVPYALLYVVSELNLRNYSVRLPIYVGVLMLLFIYQGFVFADNSSPSKTCKTYAPVFVETVAELKKNCLEIKEAAKKESAKLVILGDHYMLETISCGCGGLVNEMPLVLRPKFERRAWLWAENKSSVPGRVLFVDSQMPADSVANYFPSDKVKVRGNGYLLRTGKLKLHEVVQQLFPAK